MLIKLRPHHIISFLDHEKYPNWYYIPDSKYIAAFRVQKSDFHSDKLILFWRDTIKKIHENPLTKIKCVSGTDLVCDKCDKKSLCIDKEHWAHKETMKADEKALETGLEIGKTYTINELKEMLRNQ